MAGKGKLDFFARLGLAENGESQIGDHTYGVGTKRRNSNSSSGNNGNGSARKKKANLNGGGGGGSQRQQQPTRGPSNPEAPANCTTPATVGSPPSYTPSGSVPKVGRSDKPLVVLVDGHDCTVEMKALKDVAVLAFCDASSMNEIHEKVWADAVGLIMWNTLKLTAEDLAKFCKLRIIVRLENNAVENVDIAKATELGIAVCSVPGLGIDTTANATLSFILDLYTGTNSIASAFKEKEDVVWSPEKVLSIGKRARTQGENLGIVGLGFIGHAVAQRALAFGFKIGFYDPYLPVGIECSREFYRAQTLAELLSWADCITLHCNLTSENKHMINSNTIRFMRPGAFLVNTAHETLVDEDALAVALKSGQIGAAALDVHNGGVRFVAGPLKDAPNLILTPHSAYLTDDVYEEFRKFGIQEMRRGLTGPIPQSLLHCINKEALQARLNLLTLSQVAYNLNAISASYIPAVARFYSVTGEPLTFYREGEGNGNNRHGIAPAADSHTSSSNSTSSSDGNEVLGSEAGIGTVQAKGHGGVAKPTRNTN